MEWHRDFQPLWYLLLKKVDNLILLYLFVALVERSDGASIALIASFVYFKAPEGELTMV